MYNLLNFYGKSLTVKIINLECAMQIRTILKVDWMLSNFRGLKIYKIALNNDLIWFRCVFFLFHALSLSLYFSLLLFFSLTRDLRTLYLYFTFNQSIGLPCRLKMSGSKTSPDFFPLSQVKPSTDSHIIESLYSKNRKSVPKVQGKIDLHRLKLFTKSTNH